MGTRGQFFIGDPRDLEKRAWLGCIAYDASPDRFVRWADIRDDAAFRAAVAALGSREDFCDPAEHGFPFPWDKNLFLTDCTYAWFGGAVQFTRYRQGFMRLADFIRFSDEGRDLYLEAERTLPDDVPAPTPWDRSGPDSIMILAVPK